MEHDGALDVGLSRSITFQDEFCSFSLNRSTSNVLAMYFVKIVSEKIL
jgi:hypothetical protein